MWALRRLAWASGLLALLGCGREAPSAMDEVQRLVDLLPVAQLQQEMSAIDLGTAEARAHLVRGWSHNQSDPATGATWVWSRGPRSLLDFYLVAPRDLEIELRGTPHRRFAAGLPVEVAINGRPLARLALAAGTSSYPVSVPAEALRAGLNRMALQYQPPNGQPLAGRPAVSWDAVRLDRSVPNQRAGAAPRPPRAYRDGALYLPHRSEVAFAVEVPAGSTLELALTGTGDAGMLEVVVAGESGAPHRERLRPGRRCCRPRLLSADRGLLRLTLRAVPDRATRYQGGLRVERPRIMAPPSPRPGRTGDAHASDPATGAGAAATSPPRVPQAGPEPRPNLIFYMIDTLRADRLGCYGHRGGLTPHLDAFASEATLFERAVAQAPWTRPAVASIFTGLEPLDHGVWNLETKLAESAVTLAERLAAAGYRTAAVSTNHQVTGVFGLAQGFADFAFLAHHPGSRSANRWAFDWLAKARDGGPFFLWVHTVDPHEPYAPPPELRRRYAPDVPAEMGDAASIAATRLATGAERARRIGQLARLYDGEVVANDRSFGAFVAELHRLGLYDDALVVALADHGEEFDEHGALGHARNLHAETLDVPLVVKYPGQRAGRRVRRLVQQVDILPTILGLAGLAVPPGLPGRDLRQLAAEDGDAAAPPRAVFSHLAHNAHAMSVVRGGWKLIQPLGPPRQPARLYRWHRSGGPGEREELAARLPLRADFLRSLLDLEMLRPRGDRAAAPAEVDEETQAALRALGYL